MKAVLVHVENNAEMEEIVALLNGATAATGKRPLKIETIGKNRELSSIGYAEDLLIIPLGQVGDVELTTYEPSGGSRVKASLGLSVTASEYAILQKVHKDIRGKAPF